MLTYTGRGHRRVRNVPFLVNPLCVVCTNYDNKRRKVISYVTVPCS